MLILIFFLLPTLKLDLKQVKQQQKIRFTYLTKLRNNYPNYEGQKHGKKSHTDVMWARVDVCFFVQTVIITHANKMQIKRELFLGL